MLTESYDQPFGVGAAAEIKKALVRHLFGSRYWSSDPVVTSEMVIEGYRGRVDIALFNGHLHAFEIKSNADRLDRLPDQLERMARHFDRVTVACTPKHADSVERIALSQNMEEIGILVLRPNGRFRTVKRGRITTVRSRETLASFLLREDVETVLDVSGIRFAREEYTYLLRERATAAPIKTLRKIALSSLKTRHRERSQRLLRALSLEQTT